MKLFDYEGPLMSALIYIGELILLNVVYVLCCIPVVTIGAATAAMYKVTLDNANGYSGAVIKRFFEAFKDNFKKATIEWIVMLGVAVFLYIDFQIITQTTFSLIHMVEIVFVIVLFLYLPTLTFVFPIQAYYENTVAKNLKNAVALGIAKFPQSILLIAINYLPVILLIVNITAFFYVVPFWFIIGFSATNQISAYIFRRIFKKLNHSA